MVDLDMRSRLGVLSLKSGLVFDLLRFKIKLVVMAKEVVQLLDIS